MKKRFSLNALLKVRQQKIQIIQAELFQINHQLSQLENEKTRNTQELAEIEEEISRSSKVIERQQLDRCLHSVRFTIKGIQKEEDVLKKKLGNIQKDLSEALSKRKIVESLKTRERLNQSNLREREEVAFYDEMAQRTSTRW